MESELITLFLSIGVSGGGGYLAGYGFAWAIRLVIKAVAIASGLFTVLLAYMQTQGYLTVNWNELQESATKILEGFVDTTVISDQLNGNSDIFDVITQSLGLPVATGLGMGFGLGFMKGIRA